MEKKEKPLGGYVGDAAGVLWLMDRFVWLMWILLRTLYKFTFSFLRLSFVALKRNKTPVLKDGGGTVTSPRDSAVQTALDAVAHIVIDARYEPGTTCRLFMDGEDGWGLFMALHPGRIERTLKTERERFHWQRSRHAYNRIPLPAFTIEEAQKASLQFNFEGCIAFTRLQFETGFKTGQSRLKRAELLDFPEGAEGGSEGNSTQQVAEAGQEDASDAPSPELRVAGRVMTAGVVKITKPNGRSYDTFQVTIRSPGGREETLTGVDLREKFETRQFSIGDMVSIAKTTEKFKVGDSRRKKNSFNITVDEKANS